MFLEAKEGYDLSIESRGMSYIGDLSSAYYGDECNSIYRWKGFFITIFFFNPRHLSILVHLKLLLKTTEELSSS